MAMQKVIDAINAGHFEPVHESISTVDRMAAVYHTVLKTYWVVDFDGDIQLAGGLTREWAIDLVEDLRRRDAQPIYYLPGTRIETLVDPATTGGSYPANTRVVFPYAADEDAVG